MKHTLTALALSLIASSSFAASKVRIASFVDVVIAGDVGQYQETVSLHRNETRQMYMNEVVEAAMTLSQGMFDPGSYLQPLMLLQESADKKREQNLKIDEVGIGVSAGELLKAEIEALYEQNQISKSERNIEFITVFDGEGEKFKAKPKAGYSHYVTLSLVHVGRGYFSVNATVHENKNKGVEQSFNGVGPIEFALKQAAEKIFRSFHEDERPAWENPNPQLTWIQGPSANPMVDEQQAAMYCAGQSARLPYAEELIQAQYATNYRSGGLAGAKAGHLYHVKDIHRQFGTKIVVQVIEDGGARVDVVATNGRRGHVWCVKGSPGERIQTISQLYALRRSLDQNGMNVKFFPERVNPTALPLIKAVESLLIAVAAPGAKADVSLNPRDLMEPQAAIALLDQAGIVIALPKSMKDSL
jgi:hypothetical protein